MAAKMERGRGTLAVDTVAVDLAARVTTSVRTPPFDGKENSNKPGPIRGSVEFKLTTKQPRHDRDFPFLVH